MTTKILHNYCNFNFQFIGLSIIFTLKHFKVKTRCVSIENYK